LDVLVADEVVTPFGIRSLAWSAEKGFLLNGKAIKLMAGRTERASMGPRSDDRGNRVQLAHF
jgi:hypothetical protein